MDKKKKLTDGKFMKRLTSLNGIDLLKSLCDKYLREVIHKEIMSKKPNCTRTVNVPLIQFLSPQHKTEIVECFLRSIILENHPIQPTLMNMAMFLTLFEYLKDCIEEEIRQYEKSFLTKKKEKNESEDINKPQENKNDLMSDSEIIQRVLMTMVSESQVKHEHGSREFLVRIISFLEFDYKKEENITKQEKEEKEGEEEEKEEKEENIKIVNISGMRYYWRKKVHLVVEEILGKERVTESLYLCKSKLRWFSIIVFITSLVSPELTIGILPLVVYLSEGRKYLYGRLPEVYIYGDEITPPAIRIDFTLKQLETNSENFMRKYSRKKHHYSEMSIRLLTGKLDNVETCKSVITPPQEKTESGEDSSSSSTPASFVKKLLQRKDPNYVKFMTCQMKIHHEIINNCDRKYTPENVLRIFDQNKGGVIDFIPYPLFEVQNINEEDFKNFTESGGDMSKISNCEGNVLIEYQPNDLRNKTPCLFPCFKCQKSGRRVRMKLCTGCRLARYCSVFCQKSDWSRHKVNCKKWKERRRKKMIQQQQNQVKQKK